MISLILIVFNLAFAAALIMLFKKKSVNTGVMKNISIICAAKNEGKNIAGLIYSLKNIDYPATNFEIIIVDDNSSDDTYNQALGAAAGLENFRIIKSGIKQLPAKKGALLAGIGEAKYDYVLITDADCRVSSGWIKEYSAKFSAGFDLVFGIAPLDPGKSLVSKIAAYENLRSSLLTFSAAALNFPYSAAARSFGFSIKAFDELGGYSKTLEATGGDDDLLLREAVKKNKRIGLVTAAGAFVYSDAETEHVNYLKQKQRHTKTSLHYTAGRKAFLAAWHFINIVPFLMLPLAVINFFYIVPLIVKLILDLIFTQSFQSKFGHGFKFYQILFYQLSYELYLMVNFFNSLRSNEQWK